MRIYSLTDVVYGIVMTCLAMAFSIRTLVYFRVVFIMVKLSKAYGWAGRILVFG